MQPGLHGPAVGLFDQWIWRGRECLLQQRRNEPDLAESAFLAAIIRSPNRYNPYHDLQTATARRNQVLDSMAETGKITQDDANKAKATPLQVAPTKGRIDVSDAPYFADYVQNQLGDMIAGTGTAEHLRIYTTIDMDLQRAAYAALTKQLAELDKIEAKRFEPGTLQAASLR